jgi:hypothetical protein
MKKILFITSIALIASTSSSAIAEGTTIEKSTIINASKSTMTNTQAIADGTSAQTGSVSIAKGSKLEKSTVIDASGNTLSNTQTIGKGTTAQTGSIDVK